MALLLLQRKDRVQAALTNVSVNFDDNLVDVDGVVVGLDDDVDDADPDLPDNQRQMLDVLRSKPQDDIVVGDVMCVFADPAITANRAAFTDQPFAVLLVEEKTANTEALWGTASVRFVGVTSIEGDANAIAATTAATILAFGPRGSRFIVSRGTFGDFVTIRASLHTLVDDLTRELGLLPGGPVAVQPAPGAPAAAQNLAGLAEMFGQENKKQTGASEKRKEQTRRLMLLAPLADNPARVLSLFKGQRQGAALDVDIAAFLDLTDAM